MDKITDPELCVKALRKSIEDPIYFFNEVLGDKLDRQQEEMISQFPKHRRFVAKSGHSCFAAGTMFRMYDGSVKSVEDIEVDDLLMGDDSTPRRVRCLYHGRDRMFKVTYRDGTEYIHNGPHELVLVAMASHYAYKTGDVCEEAIEDVAAWAKEKRRRHAGFRASAEYTKKYQPIPPYILGVWLGDGYEGGGDFCNTDEEVIEELKRYSDSIGCWLSPNKNGKNWWISTSYDGGLFRRQHRNPFVEKLKEIGVFKNKHIPADYMLSTRKDRLELLAGLLDTDGSMIRPGCYDFIQKRRELSEQIVELVRSVGGSAHMSPKYVSTDFDATHHTEGVYWRVYMSFNFPIPCRIKRKKYVRGPSRIVTRFGIEKIEYLGEGGYYGFNVDGNHRILGADYMVLRNCGKDFCSARLGLWFHLTHYPSKVVITGPTERQVNYITWGELKAAYNHARYEIGGELNDSMLKSFLPDGKVDSEHFIIGFTAKDSNAFQGFHSPNLLVIVTEAPGVEARIWPGINSLMTSVGEARELCIGNATYEPDSEFYAMFTRNAAMYKQFTLDSRLSSYCSKQWIEEIRQEFGEDSPVWKARVLGVFPDDVADTLIPLAWIEKAYAKWNDAPTGLAAALGCDIARFGSDQTVFYKGEGIKFRCVHAVQGADLMDTTGRIIKFASEGISYENVMVDDTGLGGGVTDRLVEQGHRIKAINFGSNSSDQEKYANARSEIFWVLRERFRTGEIALDPSDKKLLRDLSVLRYKMTSKGQIKLEEKAEAKRRLGYSPDRADALALASVPPAIADAVAAKGKANWGLLEYMRARACNLNKSGVQDKEAASVRGMSDVPGATQALRQEGVVDGRQRQIDEARSLGI
jgi:hypothetical protein